MTTSRLSARALVLATLLSYTATAACDDGADAASGERQDTAAATEATAAVGQRAPELRAVTLDGAAVALSELEGEVVLLNVWATWCSPCRREIPELQALHEARADDGLRVVGVTVDHAGAGAEVRQFMRDFGMTYDVWWDPDQTAVSAFGAMGVPLTVLIDRDGRIAWRHLGALEREDPDLLQAVDGALDADASTRET